MVTRHKNRADAGKSISCIIDLKMADHGMKRGIKAIYFCNA